MTTTIIAEGETSALTLEKGISQLAEGKVLIPEQASVLLLIDVTLPEGTPATVNPETLGKLLDIIKAANPKKCTVIPATMKNMIQKKVLQFIGLETFIQSKAATIQYIDELDEIQSILAGFDFFIVLTQIRVHPIWTVFTSLPLLAYLNSYKFRWNARSVAEPNNPTSESSSNRWIRQSFEIFRKKAPNLIINDFFYFLDTNGPLIQQNSHTIKTKQILVSTNIIEADYYTLRKFGLDPLENRFFIYALQQNVSLPKEQEIPSELKTMIETTIRFHPCDIDPRNLILDGMQLYLGEMDEDLKENLLGFLNILQNYFFKDHYNLGKWSLIAGAAVKKLPQAGKIILFGSKANESTQNAAFRTIVKLKPTLTPDQLQRHLNKIDTQYRDLMDKNENAVKASLAEIEEKEDILEREETKLSEQKKFELTQNKFKLTSKTKSQAINYKQEQNNIANIRPKILLNTEILEIPDELISDWDYFPLVASFWTPYQAALFSIFLDTARFFYKFPEFNKKILQKDWNQRKKSFQQTLKEKYETIEKEIKQKMKEIKLAQSNQKKLWKSEFEAEKKKIAEKFKPSELELKQKYKERKEKEKLEKKAKNEAKKSLKEKQKQEEKAKKSNTLEVSALEQQKIENKSETNNDTPSKTSETHSLEINSIQQNHNDSEPNPSTHPKKHDSDTNGGTSQ